MGKFNGLAEDIQYKLTAGSGVLISGNNDEQITFDETVMATKEYVDTLIGSINNSLEAVLSGN